MDHKSTRVLLVATVLLIALVSTSDASNYWRIANKARLGNPRYTARSPRVYDKLRRNLVKRYMDDNVVNDAEPTVESWLREWVMNNRNWIRDTLFEDSFTNEI
ncbi:uncharacterized protein [Diadema antillarum]|uniref:uncharacterized protein n=1 Tax=Diadema antillarum TaxID=105358 RepID=UPI003A88EAA7